jgi:hypothetical protein
MATTLRSVACAVLFCVAGARNVDADTILITSGFITAPRITPPAGVASLTGTQGFTVEARVDPGEGRVDATFCNPCAPGAPLSVGANLSGAVFEGLFTFEGNTYTDISSVDSTASLAFELFGGGIAPAIQDGPVLFTTPFTLRGFVNLPFPLSGTTVIGRGIATVLLKPQFPNPFEPAQWLPESVRYDFGDPTPVPEPATMVLVSGGLLAIGGAARRSRRNRWQRV